MAPSYASTSGFADGALGAPHQRQVELDRVERLGPRLRRATRFEPRATNKANRCLAFPRVACRLANDLIEASAGREIFGEIADGTKRRVEITKVERGQVPTHDTDSVHEILISPGEHLEEDQILRCR